MNALMQRMRASNTLGWFVVLAGLAIFFMPTLLPVCDGLLELVTGKQIPMRCHWTAQAEMMMGGLVVLNGLMLAFAQQAETKRYLFALTVVLGVVVVLMPIYLIPTCDNPDMACNIGTKPAWMILGGMTIMMGLIGLRPETRTPSFES
jgi:hypothetical protein